MAASGFLMWLAQREIPIGKAYAIWTGIGAAGTFAVGVMFFGDAVNVGRLLGVGFIVAGVATLKLAHRPRREPGLGCVQARLAPWLVSQQPLRNRAGHAAAGAGRALDDAARREAAGQLMMNSSGSTCFGFSTPRMTSTTPRPSKATKSDW